MAGHARAVEVLDRQAGEPRTLCGGTARLCWASGESWAGDETSRAVADCRWRCSSARVLGVRRLSTRGRTVARDLTTASWTAPFGQLIAESVCSARWQAPQTYEPQPQWPSRDSLAANPGRVQPARRTSGRALRRTHQSRAPTRVQSRSTDVMARVADRSSALHKAASCWRARLPMPLPRALEDNSADAMARSRPSLTLSRGSRKTVAARAHLRRRASMHCSEDAGDSRNTGGPQARIAVSDRTSLPGLTQFLRPSAVRFKSMNTKMIASALGIMPACGIICCRPLASR